MKVKEWQVDLDNLMVSEDWNFAETKEDRIHKIHAYPAKFPAFLTTKAISYVRESGSQINIIGDVFCGCGTVAYEAKKANIEFWGCDINPVATLIADVKSSTYKVESIQKMMKNIIKVYDRQVNEKVEIDMNDVVDRIKYWYTYNSILHLTYLKNAIYEVKKRDTKYQRFFLVAFSNILKASSRWLTKSIKPTIDKNKKEIDIRKAFIKQVNGMMRAFEESSISNNIKPFIQTKNVLKTGNDNVRLDLVMTSPPYVTSYEYADLHQLSTLWLDYVTDYRELRKGTIGSVYDVEDFKRDVKYLNSTGESIVFQLYKQDKARSKSAARYYVDMQKVVNLSFDKLNDDGFAVFVIGNTEYKGVRIDNTQHLMEAMYKEGFRNLEVIKRKISNKILTPYRDSGGKFTNSSTGRKIYAEEFIVIGKKIVHEY